MLTVTTAVTSLPSETGFGATANDATASGKSLSVICISDLPESAVIAYVSWETTDAAAIECSSQRLSSGSVITTKFVEVA